MADFRFEIAVSFAGDNKRDKVRRVAELLRTAIGADKVFFDEWFEAELAGHDGQIVLQNIYRRETRLVVTCVCTRYAEKPWTQDEWRAILSFERGLRDAGSGNEKRLRFLPLRFGDGDIDGLFDTAIVPDVRNRPPEQIAGLILERLRKIQRAEDGSRTALEAAAPPPAGLPDALLEYADADKLCLFIESVARQQPGIPPDKASEPRAFLAAHQHAHIELAIVSGLIVLARQARHLDGSADELIGRSLSWTCDDRHTWNVGVRSSILTASLEAAWWGRHAWEDDKRVSSYLTGRIGLAGRGYRIVTPVILFAPDEVSARMAAIAGSTMAKLKPGDREHPMLIACESLRACLVAIAETNPELIDRILPRIQRVLGLIDLSFYDTIWHEDKVHELRLLIIHCHLIQCEKVAADLCRSYTPLTDALRAYIVQRLLHADDLMRVVSMIDLAVRRRAQWWQVEGACLHVGSDWQDGTIRGPLRDALIEYYDTAIHHRTSYRNAGWWSWRDIMLVFGRYCVDPDVRKLANDAARQPVSF